MLLDHLCAKHCSKYFALINSFNPHFIDKEIETEILKICSN